MDQCAYVLIVVFRVVILAIKYLLSTRYCWKNDPRFTEWEYTLLLISFTPHGYPRHKSRVFFYLIFDVYGKKFFALKTEIIRLWIYYVQIYIYIYVYVTNLNYKIFYTKIVRKLFALLYRSSGFREHPTLHVSRKDHNLYELSKPW